MNRAYYSDSIERFLNTDAHQIIGTLAKVNEFDLLPTQKNSWDAEIEILRNTLKNFSGTIYFEYSIPRMGQRIDVVLLIKHVIFVLEFKIGDKEFTSQAVDQVWDYALDLKNFHETSHDKIIAPILIATKAKDVISEVSFTTQNDELLLPIKCNESRLGAVIETVLSFTSGQEIDNSQWETGRYHPTPTIIEAALALYKGHSVEDISRKDASAEKLRTTTNAISELISFSKENSRKSICFVTGVPGAGKTLVGLNIATTHKEDSNELHSVFLSGNGPLVAVLRGALVQDRVNRAKEFGERITKKEAMSKVKAFIQNIHNFRDDCLIDVNRPPNEHVALFDEAQRAWNLNQTANFMQRRKNVSGFNKSEPEFLISCLERHKDWAVIVCLVGGGQEINTGEAGIGEWIESLNRSFPHWDIYISPKLKDEEYGSGEILKKLQSHQNVKFKEELHLSVSMRSFRAEYVSQLIKEILDLYVSEANASLKRVEKKYPIVLTRDIGKAKQWLKSKAQASERYGIVVSSQAARLKPYAIDVKSPIDPVHWFLDGKEDVRSSYYLEDVATEFHVQGLELDWVCVTWDADFRYTPNGWTHWSFVGKKWNRIKKEERKTYLKNAYRVLLTRARQGMVIVVPSGDSMDHTRDPKFYDDTYEYLKSIGLEMI